MLNLCLSIAARQAIETPKIEDVLVGPNAAVADSAARWRTIAKFVEKRIETVNPKDVAELRDSLNKAGLVSNDEASFGLSIAPIQDQKKGYLVWMSVTSREKPEKLSRQASFLYLWERGHVVSHYLSAPLIKKGFLSEGLASRHRDWILVGGTNGGVVGEAGYGTAVAIALKRTANGWRQTAYKEIGGSGKIDKFLAREGQPSLSFSLYTNHSDVLRSHYQSPTFAESATVRFNGKSFEITKKQPVKNRYWVVSEFIKALQKGDQKEASQFVETPKMVDFALKAGVGAQGIVWNTIEGSRGDFRDIQINQKLDGVWYSISFWFKGEGLKIAEIEQHQPKK